MTHWLGLQGRIAVITGASGGLGRAIAAALAEAGATTALLDRDTAGLQAAAAALGGNPFTQTFDISDPASVHAAAAAVQSRLGAAHILVNNAGLLRAGNLDTLSLADWNDIIAVNLTGAFLCAQGFGSAMLAAGRGALIHTASIAASNAQAGSGAYSVSKSGVHMLSRQLASEWGPRGVRSNVVSPGLVRTPMSESFYTAPGVTERRSAAVPMRRIGTPTDIAEAVAFLASDRASYINGEEIIVDGGFTRTIMNLIPRPGHQ